MTLSDLPDYTVIRSVEPGTDHRPIRVKQPDADGGSTWIETGMPFFAIPDEEFGDRITSYEVLALPPQPPIGWWIGYCSCDNADCALVFPTDPQPGTEIRCPQGPRFRYETNPGHREEGT